jgi:hypothetical protein
VGVPGRAGRKAGAIPGPARPAGSRDVRLRAAGGH